MCPRVWRYYIEHDWNIGTIGILGPSHTGLEISWQPLVAKVVQQPPENTLSNQLGNAHFP